MKKVYVNWSDVERQTQELIRQMYLDDWHPDYIVGITRGGLTPATLIRETIGWPPEDNLEHGLTETYRWISQQLEASTRS